MSEVITVKKLKEIIKDWPEGTDEDPAEVWISTTDGKHSNACVEVTKLNRIDMLLETRIFNEDVKLDIKSTSQSSAVLTWNFK